MVWSRWACSVVMLLMVPWLKTRRCDAGKPLILCRKQGSVIATLLYFYTGVPA
ncbi:hypothetical protein ACLB1T_09810 [Escherichia coli]